MSMHPIESGLFTSRTEYGESVFGTRPVVTRENPVLYKRNRLDTHEEWGIEWNCDNFAIFNVVELAIEYQRFRAAVL